MFVHRLHGLCTSHAKCAFLHGPHADDTFALPPIRLTPLPFPFPFGPERDSPGEAVPLEEEASPVRCGCIWAVSYEPEPCELGYDPGTDMNGTAVTGVGGGDKLAVGAY
jgi:hypothetical protein